MLESLSRGLTNKFLHLPSHALNSASAGERDELVESLIRLYQLHVKE